MSLRDLKIDKSWTLFLDRDGVINKRIVGGYVRKWEEFEWMPGALEAIRTFSEIFGRIVIVSNQQGIGKGLMTDEELAAIHKKLISEVERSGGRIDAIYYCPALRETNSFLRKPSIGMALKARKQFPEINFRKSVMAGDSISDMVFGRRLKMFTVFLCDDLSTIRKAARLINYTFRDLSALSAALTKTS